MRELKNVVVTHVSFVDKAANKRKFLLTKSEDGSDKFEHQVKAISKADDPQQLVYGVVYEPDVEDAHGDFMTSDEIEKAAHGFMENYQQIDKQHDFTSHAGQVVESYIAPDNMTIGKTKITKGTWVLVTKASDEIWDAVQKGEFTGYSLAGNAEVIEKATESIFSNNQPRMNLTSLLRAFNDAVDRIIWKDGADWGSKCDEIMLETNEFNSIVTKIKENPAQIIKEKEEKQGLMSHIKSFFNTQKQEDNTMNSEDITKAVTEAVKPFAERLEALEKGSSASTNDVDDNKPIEASENADIGEVIKQAVKEAVQPIDERLSKIEKARISNIDEPSYSSQVKKESVASYVDAVFPME